MTTDSRHDVILSSRAERLARGRVLRKSTPRSAHAKWEPTLGRPDIVSMLEASSRNRLPELVPIRYARMLPSPFTFLRGSAGIMAYDLSTTPVTGERVQLCGDCHLLNFGCYGTPERNFAFDLVDFDESLPGPWEWDVKRLAASVVVAGRSIGLGKRSCRDAALSCVRTYREQMLAFSGMHPLDVWYAHIEGRMLLEIEGAAALRRRREGTSLNGLPHRSEHLSHHEVVDTEHGRRFRDKPPLVAHPPHGDRFEAEMRHFLANYRESLQDDRRTLLSRFHFVDLALKVVGIGSVGMRCAMLLLTAGEGADLVLQYKEAGPSVLEPFLGKSKLKSHAQRVVRGQRLLQSASDMFLGWASDEAGRHFYFRQLRDMKVSVNVEGMSSSALAHYASLCGWALARAHARSGDPVVLAGYLGRNDRFDRAIARFAETYADQVERDWQAMADAASRGQLALADGV